MAKIPYRTALIVGAGAGISASLARGLAAAGSRSGWRRAMSTSWRRCRRNRRRRLRRRCLRSGGRGAAVRGRWTRGSGSPMSCSTTPAPGAWPDRRDSTRKRCARRSSISAFGGFLVVQQAARRMIPRGRGAILLTGASASVKGYPLSAAFAMGKFASARPRAKRGARTGAEGHPCRAFRHRWRRCAAPAPARPSGAAGQHARSRRDRPDLPRCPAPAAQRLVARGRDAALGGDVLRSLGQNIWRHFATSPHHLAAGT